MTNNQPLMDIKDLSIEFRTDEGVVKAVNDLSLSIGKGKTLGLVGETGAGKTTTGLAMLSLIPNPPGVITQGSIHFNGMDILNASEEEMQKVRGHEISMIFQDPMTSLNPVLVVREQIAEVFEYHENLSESEAMAKADRMLELVGIPAQRGSEYPHQFSGGMKQRVVIAMALAGNPKLLISDEPTTALDVTIQAQVLKMMKELILNSDMAMLMITHDLGVVAETCDDVAIMYAGHIIEFGSLEDIFDHTRHPYTEGLFNSIPKLGERVDRLKPIKGLMPDPTNLPAGCPFCDRCAYSTDRCRTQKPPKVFRNEKHFVECFLYDEKNIQEGGVLQRG